MILSTSVQNIVPCKGNDDLENKCTILPFWTMCKVRWGRCAENVLVVKIIENERWKWAMETHEDFYCWTGKENGRLMITVKERCDDHRDPSAIEHLGGSGSYPIASPWCSLYCLVCCRWRKREGSGILEYNLNCMDWIHMVNLPRDFVEFEFLYSSRSFLRTIL